MRRKIKDLKNDDVKLFQEPGCDISYLGRVVEISEDYTTATVQSNKTQIDIDNSYKIFKVY